MEEEREIEEGYELDTEEADVSGENLVDISREAAGSEMPDTEAQGTDSRAIESELEEYKEKYLRLYAEFENYRKRVNRDKEELVKYANESLVHELLPSLDHMRIALSHASESDSKAIVEGVENTLRGLEKSLERFGLKPIEAVGKPFDPEYHHAMSQVETDDVPEGTVVEEMRKGYLFGDKVLRASMVTVSKMPS